jgi:hypothetical protein
MHFKVDFLNFEMLIYSNRVDLFINYKFMIYFNNIYAIYLIIIFLPILYEYIKFIRKK